MNVPSPARPAHADALLAVAAILYGVSLLTAGWALGPIRVLLVAPRLGAAVALLLEAPMMLALAAAAAWGLLSHGWGWTTRRERLALGLSGAAITLVGEFVIGALVWGLASVDATMAAPQGRVGLLLVAITAILPALMPEPARDA